MKAKGFKHAHAGHRSHILQNVKKSQGPFIYVRGDVIYSTHYLHYVMSLSKDDDGDSVVLYTFRTHYGSEILTIRLADLRQDYEDYRKTRFSGDNRTGGRVHLLRLQKTRHQWKEE